MISRRHVKKKWIQKTKILDFKFEFFDCRSSIHKQKKKITRYLIDVNLIILWSVKLSWELKNSPSIYLLAGEREMIITSLSTISQCLNENVRLRNGKNSFAHSKKRKRSNLWLQWLLNISENNTRYSLSLSYDLHIGKEVRSWGRSDLGFVELIFKRRWDGKGEFADRP